MEEKYIYFLPHSCKMESETKREISPSLFKYDVSSSEIFFFSSGALRVIIN